MKLHKELFAKIFLVFFSAILVTIFYKGVIAIPNEGDSVDYHIPHAKAFLTGEILNPQSLDVPSHTKFYPSNAEGILGIFALFDLPLGLFNVLGIVILFFSCLKLAKSFDLDENLAIIFSVSISSLNGILRWADTQIIDIYLLSFFILTLSHLEKPRKEISYFLKLGFFAGLLIGSKFSAPFIAFALFVVYLTKIIKVMTVRNLFALIVPVFLLGGGWYLRNFFITGNPFYPQAFLFFPGQKSTILDVSVIDILTGPLSGLAGNLNAFISEYMVWSFLLPITLVFILFRKESRVKVPLRLIFIGVFVSFFALNLPSSSETHIMTSSMRYFLPAITSFILFSFLYWSENKKVIFLILSALTSLMLLGFPQGYFPKLIFIAAPLSVIVYFKGYDVLVKIIKRYF